MFDDCVVASYLSGKCLGFALEWQGQCPSYQTDHYHQLVKCQNSVYHCPPVNWHFDLSHFVSLLVEPWGRQGVHPIHLSASRDFFLF